MPPFRRHLPTSPTTYFCEALPESASSMPTKKGQELLKKTVPNQMEEADEKSRPLKDPPSSSAGRPNSRRTLHKF